MTKILKIGFSFLFLFAFASTVQAAIPLDVVINEILPAPVGSDIEEEWIEISNPNDFEVNLSGWKIQDTIGKTKIYTFPKETKISAKGFLVLKRPITKITLNNDGDGLKLTDSDGKTIDEISYQKAEKGKSYNKTPLESSKEDLTGQAESGWVWSSSLTPGSQNIIPTQNLEVEKEKSSEFAGEKELAAVGEGIPKENLSPFFVAIGIAIFSGIIILFLKKTLNKAFKEVE